MSRLQSLQGRDVQLGVATQVFSRMTRSVRGRGPGKRVDPAGVVHTGSTALMPGKGTKGIPKKKDHNFNEVLTHFLQITLILSVF